MRKLLLLALCGLLSVIMLAGTVPASMAVLGGESVDWSKHTEIAKLEIGSGGSFCTGSVPDRRMAADGRSLRANLDYGIAGNREQRRGALRKSHVRPGRRTATATSMPTRLAPSTPAPSSLPPPTFTYAPGSANASLSPR